jgi:hypothetical protein
LGFANSTGIASRIRHKPLAAAKLRTGKPLCTKVAFL